MSPVSMTPKGSEIQMTVAPNELKIIHGFRRDEVSKQAEKSLIFLKPKSRQAGPKVVISLFNLLFLFGQKDVIIAKSIYSAHVKNACVYVGQMYSIVIFFRRIDINIAFNSRQTPNFACNWVPPFQCLPLGHLL